MKVKSEFDLLWICCADARRDVEQDAFRVDNEDVVDACPDDDDDDGDIDDDDDNGDNPDEDNDDARPDDDDDEEESIRI